MPPKKKKNNNTRNKNINQFSPEPFAHDNFENELGYAKIITTLGDCRFTCLIDTGQELVGRISGRAKKRGRINVGDIVLVSKRDFETGITRSEKVDILHKYNPDTARKLQNWGELDFLKSQDTETDMGDLIGFSNDDNDIDIDDI